MPFFTAHFFLFGHHGRALTGVRAQYDFVYETNARDVIKFTVCCYAENEKELAVTKLTSKSDELYNYSIDFADIEEKLPDNLTIVIDYFTYKDGKLLELSDAKYNFDIEGKYCGNVCLRG